MNNVKKVLFIFFTFFNILYAQEHANEKFKYFTPLTPQEQKSIHFIIHTLGTKSTLTLMWHQGDLEKAGDQTFYVHPLRFWKEILSNENLSKLLKRIGAVPKKRMIADVAKSFEKIDSMGLLTDDQLRDFSQSTGYPYPRLKELVQKHDWKSLAESFFTMQFSQNKTIKERQVSV